MSSMLTVPEVRSLLKQRIEKKKDELIFKSATGAGFDEVSVNLKPDKTKAAADIRAFDQWESAWKKAVFDIKSSGVSLEEKPVRWPNVGGSRNVLSHLRISSLEGLLEFAGDRELSKKMERSISRLKALKELKSEAYLQRVAKESEIIESSDDLRLKQVVSLTDYLASNKADCYIRELPVEGVDTKFLEKHKRLVCDLLSIETGKEVTPKNFFEDWNIKVPPLFVRVRHAQAFYFGIPDELPIALPLASLISQSRALVMVENVQTGLSVKSVPAEVPIIMGLGFQVNRLAELEWIKKVPIYYFGDLDMHGLLILSNLRQIAPQTKSFLMDKDTLKKFEKFAVTDPNEPKEMTAPSGLTDEEADLFNQLVSRRLRLEQERIPLNTVEEKLKELFSSNAQ